MIGDEDKDQGQGVDLSGVYKVPQAKAAPTQTVAPSPASKLDADSSGGVDLSKTYQVKGKSAPTETTKSAQGMEKEGSSEEEEQPGYGKRLAQSLGVPLNKEEVQAAQPSMAETVLGPTVTAGKALYNYGKTAYKGAKEGYNEVKDAVSNIEAGESVMPNVGKAGYGILHAGLQATPFIGPATETAGEDIEKGNYAGAAGGLTGVIGQVAAPYVEGKVAEAGGPMAAARKVVTSPVRGAAKAYNFATQDVPGAAGYLVGGRTGSYAAKGLGKILPEAGEGLTQFGRTPEEVNAIKLEEDAKKAETNSKQARSKVLDYSAGQEQLPDGTPELQAEAERIRNRAEQLETIASQKRLHADAAKERIRNGAPKNLPEDQPITSSDVKPVAQPEVKPQAPINVKKPGEVAPEQVGVQPDETVTPVDRGADVPLPGGGVLKGNPKALPAYEEPRGINVKGPGEVKPEVFPQPLQGQPLPPRGRLDLANEQGVRQGETLRLPEKGTEPRGEVLPPERLTPKKPLNVPKTIDQTGKLIQEGLGNPQAPEVKAGVPIREQWETPSKAFGRAIRIPEEPASVEPKAVEEVKSEEKTQVPKEVGPSEDKLNQRVAEAIAEIKKRQEVTPQEQTKEAPKKEEWRDANGKTFDDFQEDLDNDNSDRAKEEWDADQREKAEKLKESKSVEAPKKEQQQWSSEPRKAVLQKAGATPEEIEKILPKGAKPGQTGLTKVEMSKLAEHFGVDLGDKAIGRGKGDLKAGTHVPQHEVLQKIIDAGHSPADIAKAIVVGHLNL